MPALTHANPHHSFLTQRLPTWTQHTRPEDWHHLRQSLMPPQGAASAEAGWFASAPPGLRQAVLDSQVDLRRCKGSRPSRKRRSVRALRSSWAWSWMSPA
ncbi:hypothetical protein [Pseudomonas donghuensis]|uniref:hypothetical protein n=1 Tax=Pseudomonas donghuensis TaxID=1163398 RepID=UPI000C2AA0A5|nr:hypothetical protein [Pseudomonas donghuensis]PJY93363.1 hypothetical protein COO64_26420 [Pseudomonas donghuensis]WKY26098.1 hypothetical protein QYF67_14320 [Pseudomonas donghuensis]